MAETVAEQCGNGSSAVVKTSVRPFEVTDPSGQLGGLAIQGQGVPANG